MMSIESVVVDEREVYVCVEKGMGSFVCFTVCIERAEFIESALLDLLIGGCHNAASD